MDSTKTIHFTKMKGVGNDFVLIDGRGERNMDWSSLAREVCDRRFGIGADGLLVIDNSHLADVMMRMYNPDGTPDVCGNGLRCVARYVAERSPDIRDSGDNWTFHTPYSAWKGINVRIATLAGVRRATVLDNRVVVDMGEPRFAPADIPMIALGPRVINMPLELGGDKVVITALSTGTTHSVIFVDELPDDGEFNRLSPLIEHHPQFPERTSIMWTKVESSSQLSLRIWERGAGETWGCGTGACAAAVAATLHSFVEGPVIVASKGGELTIHWQEGEPICMFGPAEYVFEGVYPLQLTSRST